MSTIEDSMPEFLKEVASMRSPATVRTYRSGLAYFRLYLEEVEIPVSRDVSTLDPGKFVDFFPFLYDISLSDGSLRVYSASVKAYVEWLLLKGFLEWSHGDGVRFQKSALWAAGKRNKRFPRTPADGNAEKLIAAAKILTLDSPIKERDLAIALFLYSSGCRANEAVTLSIRDLDLDQRSAIVTGKGQKDRMVFYSSEAAIALVRYWNIRGFQGKSSPIFCRHDRGAGTKAKPLTTKSLQNIVDLLAQAAGVDQFTPHSFRHAFAIRVLRETHGNLTLVQDLLGHSDPSTTRIYAEIVPEERKALHHEIYK